MLTDRANTICLYLILAENSDENHILPMKRIIDCFHEQYGLKLDRRTIYGSIDTLREIGIDICTYDENKKGYYLRSRILSVADIRIISDALYSLNSISNKQTEELIDRLQLLLSRYSRQHFKHLSSAASSMRKTDNTAVFNNIELLDAAITRRSKVSFIYMHYGLDKRLHQRRAERYIVSPYSMVCENGNYYLICIKEGKSGLSHYRIDLMKEMLVLASRADTRPSGVELEAAQKTVYAFSGEPEAIVLRCKNSMIGGLIDRFGTEPKIKRIDNEHFEARITSVPQGVLFWTMQYLNEVEILKPDSLREQAIEMIKSNSYGV